MLLIAVVLLVLLPLLVRGLRYPIYGLHVALVLIGVWLLDPQGAFQLRFDSAALVPVLLLHLLAINITVVVAYWWDKNAARNNRRRIPERTLHALALVGGTPGAWVASKVFHHKSIKQSFRRTFTLILVVQVVVLAVALLWFWWQGGMRIFS